MKVCLRIASRALFVFATFALVSCAAKQSSPEHGVISARLFVNQHEVDRPIWVKVETPEKIWLPARELMDVLGFRIQQNERFVRFGYYDPLYTVQANAHTAMFGAQPRVLPEAPRILSDGRLYLPVDSLASLLNGDTRWDPEKKRLDLSLRTTAITEARDEQNHRAISFSQGADLVRFAERFIGTPYEFGAGPYTESGAFDCSSFIQYIYDRFGFDLPRLSIDQAGVGKRVNVDELKKGDLLFFYTPGRYASDRVVGHVGIYAGNGEFIHTYGEPGVTKDHLEGYWEKRLLFAKRLFESSRR